MTETRRVIFSGDEVRAYMAGRKTQFRRVIPDVPAEADILACSTLEEDDEGALWAHLGSTDLPMDPGGYETVHSARCPFGRPGDRLWVAETYGYVCDFSGDGPPIGRPYLEVPEDANYEGYSRHIIYRADGEFPWYDEDGRPGSFWKPSTTMPRTASRLTPEVVDVRVQRVQDITVEECVTLEGITDNGEYETACPDCRGFGVVGWSGDSSRDCVYGCSTPRGKVAALWDSTNAKHGNGWDQNRWVCAVTVKPYEERKSQ